MKQQVTPISGEGAATLTPTASDGKRAATMQIAKTGTRQQTKRNVNSNTCNSAGRATVLKASGNTDILKIAHAHTGRYYSAVLQSSHYSLNYALANYTFTLLLRLEL